MRKILKFTGTWIMAVIVVLLFSCDEEPEPFGKYPKATDTHLDPTIYMKGHWTSINAVSKDYTDTKDLTEYFKDFHMTIDQGMAICSVNGCETWRAVKAWENNCTVFEKIQDRNTMLFDVKSVSTSNYTKMTVIIQKEEPGFSFLPEKWNTGNYIVRFVR